MLSVLRCASGAGASQRQILAPSPGRGGGRGVRYVGPGGATSQKPTPGSSPTLLRWGRASNSSPRWGEAGRGAKTPKTLLYRLLRALATIVSWKSKNHHVKFSFVLWNYSLLAGRGAGKCLSPDATLRVALLAAPQEGGEKPIASMRQCGRPAWHAKARVLTTLPDSSEPLSEPALSAARAAGRP
jgi:hypothetical protein